MAMQKLQISWQPKNLISKNRKRIVKNKKFNFTAIILHSTIVAMLVVQAYIMTVSISLSSNVNHASFCVDSEKFIQHDNAALDTGVNSRQERDGTDDNTRDTTTDFAARMAKCRQEQARKVRLGEMDSNIHMSKNDIMKFAKKLSHAKEAMPKTSNKMSALSMVQMKHPNHKVIPCERKFVNGDCNPMDHQIVVYNPWFKAKHVEGDVCIRPHSVRESVSEEMPRIFEQEPALENIAMDPINALTNQEEKSGVSKKCLCDVPCKTWGLTRAHDDVRRIEDTNWKFVFSMESKGCCLDLAVGGLMHMRNHFYATASFRSEIPLPCFSWNDSDVRGSQVDYDASIQGASFIASNCLSKNHREAVVRESSKIFWVDSLGACLKNADTCT